MSIIKNILADEDFGQNITKNLKADIKAEMKKSKKHREYDKISELSSSCCKNMGVEDELKMREENGIEKILSQTVYAENTSDAVPNDNTNGASEFADTVEYKTEIITRPQRIRRVIWNSCAAVLCLTTAVAMLKLINNTPPMIEDNAPEIIDDVNLPNNHSVQMTTENAEKSKTTGTKVTKAENQITESARQNIITAEIKTEFVTVQDEEYVEEIHEDVVLLNNNPPSVTTATAKTTTVITVKTTSVQNTEKPIVTTSLKISPESDFRFDSKNGVIEKYYGNESEVVIPEKINGVKVKCIGIAAFCQCKDIFSITIPKSVESLSDMAFYECTNLESLTIPNSVTVIGSDAFGGCCSLKSLVIPDSVTKIGSRAFIDCSSLKSITVPDSVIGYASSLFQKCSNLESVKIGNGITAIEGLFFGCKNLKTVILSDNLKEIHGLTFYDCTNLESIEIPYGVVKIGNKAFKGCNNLKTILIPNSVADFGEDTFAETLWLKEQCQNNPLVIVNNTVIYGRNLTGEVAIPNGVTGIGNGAFKNNDNLTNIVIPDSVVRIGEKAFYGCDNLNDVTIPITVKIINEEALGYHCGDVMTGESKKNSNFTIFGYDNTVSEMYAEWNDINYISIGVGEPIPEISTQA